MIDWQDAFVILLIIVVVVSGFGGAWLWMWASDRYREGWAAGRAAERDEWLAQDLANIIAEKPAKAVRARKPKPARPRAALPAAKKSAPVS